MSDHTFESLFKEQGRVCRRKGNETVRRCAVPRWKSLKEQTEMWSVSCAATWMVLSWQCRETLEFPDSEVRYISYRHYRVPDKIPRLISVIAPTLYLTSRLPQPHLQTSVRGPCLLGLSPCLPPKGNLRLWNTLFLIRSSIYSFIYSFGLMNSHFI